MFFLALAVAVLSLPPQASRKFEPQQLREDFQIARQSLEEGHSGLYRYTPKAQLDRVFTAAEASLDHPMDFFEFYGVMARVIAAIKCGHTDVSMPSEITEETERVPRLPFDVKVLDSKAYIFRDYARRGALAGKEIQSINGVPAPRIIAAMLAADSRDGDIQSSRQGGISGDFGLNLITLLGLRAPYAVVLAGAERLHLTGTPHQEMAKLSKQAVRPFAAIHFLDGGRIAYLTYASFGTSVEQGQGFLQQAFENIKSKGSKALILDLRGNGGGEDELGKALLSYLLDAPFQYYDDLVVNQWSFSFLKYTDGHSDLTIPKDAAELRADGRIHALMHPNLGLQQPGKPAFTGPVYILIDSGCFSTTAEFLTAVHAHHRATFIGEESGGGYYGNTSGTVVKIKLPHTGLGIYIPLVSYYMSTGGNHEHPAARGIVPDFPVKRTIADLLDGTDRDYALALELARKGL